MINCPNCGKENQDHYKFCLGCGAKLPAPGAAVPQPSGDDGTAPQGYVQAGQPAQPGQPQPPHAGYPAGPAPVHAHPAPGPAPQGYPTPGATPQPGAYQPATPQPQPQQPAAPAEPTNVGPAPVAPGSGACSKCGTQNPPGFKFCGACGNKLEPIAPAEPGGAAPASGGDMGSARTVFMDAGSAPEAPAPGASAPAPGPNQEQEPHYSARLVLLRDDGTEGGVLVLEGGPEHLGRGYGPPFDSDVYLDPKHVAVQVTAEGLRVADNGSLNGLYMKLEGKTELQDKDQFRVGQELMLYEDLPEAEPMGDGTEQMGSPNPGYWGRLSVVVSPGRACSAFPIEGDGCTIGRELGEITFPEDGYVSGSHCRVFGDDSGVYLEDLGSSNGTYVRIRDEQIVSFGSLILVGQQLFRLEQV